MIRVGADLSVRPQNRLRSGEDGRTHRSAPTEIGVTASGWRICRVDVIRVGADLRIRPQDRLRSGEDETVAKVNSLTILLARLSRLCRKDEAQGAEGEA